MIDLFIAMIDIASPMAHLINPTGVWGLS